MLKEKTEEVMEFAETIRERLYDIYPTAQIDINDVRKNNDKHLIGICIIEQGKTITPRIYLNDIYDMYTSGHIDMDEAIKKIQEIYTKGLKDADLYEFNPDDFLNEEKIVQKLIVKLVGKEHNNEYLSDAVYIDVFPGLVAVFYVLISVEENGILSTKLNRRVFKRLDISLDKAFEIALQNTIKIFPAKVVSITKLIRNKFGEDIEDIIPSADAENCMAGKMFVLTNNKELNGATALLYPNVLRNFCNEHKFEKVILIPSSIHELILLEYDKTMLPDDMKSMVEDANNMVVMPEEVLSNNVYIYDAGINQISLFK